MPRSPLPPRHGLDAAWLRTPDNTPGSRHPWATLREYLAERLPPDARVAERLASGEFVDDRGRPFAADAPYRPHTLVFFHRSVRPEPGPRPPLPVLWRDERIVAIDKPSGVATTPRGSFVARSALVRLRVELDLPELTAAHRLDRGTAGVLLFTTRRECRGQYQALFATGAAAKTYEALAPALPGPWPRVVASHLTKPAGSLQVVEVPGADPNAETLVDLVERRGALARYRLTPRTGRTHQLRVQLSGLGAPIVGDPLYPTPRLAEPEDALGGPLRLVARELAFTDPVDGTPRRFVSAAELRWPSGAA